MKINDEDIVADFLKKTDRERPCLVCRTLTTYIEESSRAYICSANCLNKLEELISKSEDGSL